RSRPTPTTIRSASKAAVCPCNSCSRICCWPTSWASRPSTTRTPETARTMARMTSTTAVPAAPARFETDDEIQHLSATPEQPAARTDVPRPAGQRGALRPAEVPDLRKADREAAVVLLAPRGSRRVPGSHRLLRPAGARAAHLPEQPEVPDAARLHPGPQPQRGAAAAGVAAGAGNLDRDLGVLGDHPQPLLYPHHPQHQHQPVAGLR